MHQRSAHPLLRSSTLQHASASAPLCRSVLHHSTLTPTPVSVLAMMYHNAVSIRSSMRPHAAVSAVRTSRVSYPRSSTLIPVSVSVPRHQAAHHQGTTTPTPVTVSASTNPSADPSSDSTTLAAAVCAQRSTAHTPNIRDQTAPVCAPKSPGSATMFSTSLMPPLATVSAPTYRLAQLLRFSTRTHVPVSAPTPPIVPQLSKWTPTHASVYAPTCLRCAP